MGGYHEHGIGNQEEGENRTAQRQLAAISDVIACGSSRFYFRLHPIWRNRDGFSGIQAVFGNNGFEMGRIGAIPLHVRVSGQHAGILEHAENFAAQALFRYGFYASLRFAYQRGSQKNASECSADVRVPASFSVLGRARGDLPGDPRSFERIG